MSEDLEKKVLTGAAYRIFMDELGKHLEATKALFASAEWSPEQLREASGRFHTIRGGAGFFRFTKLASLAGELETLLDGNSPEELANDLELLRSLSDDLRLEAESLPPPNPA
jgi:chemotaxis protein histidine kinase CheA